MGVTSVLDTNVVLYALRDELADPLPNTDILISVITEIELLGYPSLTPAQEQKIRTLLQSLTVIPLDERVKDEAITIRKTTRLRLPDAIVLATAVVTGSTLVTNDQGLLAQSSGPTRTVQTK